MLVAGLFIPAPTQATTILNQTGRASIINSTASAGQSNATTSTGAVSTLAIIPLATLAGFNWEWALMIFKRIGDSFKEEIEPDDKVEK